MEHLSDNRQPRTRKRRGWGGTGYLILAIVAGILAGGYFYLRQEAAPPLSPTSADSIDKTEPAQGLASREPGARPEGTGDHDQPAPLQAGASSTSTSEGDDASRPVEGIAVGPISPDGSPASADSTATSPQDSAPETLPPDQVLARIDEFYSHLDQQTYLREAGVTEPSRIYFSRLLQKLADNPPVVVRETDDLYTILKNTAHFFRVLGKDNVALLKTILERERDSIERLLQSFYALSLHPDLLKNEFALSLPANALNNYGAFFLNTMGGRLYLFRRDPKLRMLASYYAILAIDQAKKEGRGEYGIDLRPAIRSLIEEIDNGGSRLELRDRYLDRLYDLEHQYSLGN